MSNDTTQTSIYLLLYQMEMVAEGYVQIHYQNHHLNNNLLQQYGEMF